MSMLRIILKHAGKAILRAITGGATDAVFDAADEIVDEKKAGEERQRRRGEIERLAVETARRMRPARGLQRIYGIDLGTTYSSIAYVNDEGCPAIIPNRESERLTPSVVRFDGGNVIVGSTAKESAKVEPDRVVARVKQHMGDPNFVFQYEGQVYSPEDISSFILRKVVGDAELALGDEKITDVVITCPAWFGTAEREATVNAGILAGLNVRSILNEPTAAAIAYAFQEAPKDQVILVYDLGGGTFDTTIIEVKEGIVRVICTGGDHHLGGGALG